MAATAQLLCMAFAFTPAFARQDSDLPADEPGSPNTGWGGQILLNNSGFGLGGYLLHFFNEDLALVSEISLSAAKDEREVAFFDRFGRKEVPNKANYLLLLPIRIGLEKRLFRDRIEDNFRPFLHLTAGPTLGWKSPYFRDSNGNGVFDDGEKTFDAISAFPRGTLETGIGGGFAVGAYFGSTADVVKSVRIGYTFTWFSREIELLERSIRRPNHFFGSPVIVLSFGQQH